MKKFLIYHNPKCSKSRKALEILKSHQVPTTVIEYLKTPLNLKELTSLSSYFSLDEFVRTNEVKFKQMNLSLTNKSQVLEAIVKEPILMQRPIVTYNGKAVIARPPEKVLSLIT